MFDLYKKITIGDVITYVRPYQTLSHGPLNGENSMTISEELITILPDASVTNVPLGTAELQVTITDPNESFNIVHPVTGAVTGTMTFAQLKVQMYSLYLHLATVRDENELNEAFPQE